MQGIHYDFCLRHLEPNCMGVEYDIEISSTPQKQLLFWYLYEMVAQNTLRRCQGNLAYHI